MKVKVSTLNDEFDKELMILGVFFNDSEKGFQIREVSRILKINPTTIREYLNIFVKKGYLKVEERGVYPAYYSNINKKYTNLKAFYNLELIRKSGIVEFLEKEYSYPAIVLFGSFSSGTNNKNSDIDIFILSEIKKEVLLEDFEKYLNKKINLMIVDKKDFSRIKEKNPPLINNLIRGVVLSGELEILWHFKEWLNKDSQAE